LRRNQIYEDTVLAFRDTTKSLCRDNNGETKWKEISTKGDMKKVIHQET